MLRTHIDSKTFPFHVLSDNEISSLFGDLNHEINLINDLPFYDCSDFMIMDECMSANSKVLKWLENNGFLKKYIELIESYT